MPKSNAALKHDMLLPIEHCLSDCRHMVLVRRTLDGPPEKGMCSRYKVRNPKIPGNRKYKHWGRSASGTIARDLQMLEGHPIACDECILDKQEENKTTETWREEC